MKFSLVIYSAPSSQASYSAYRFAQALLEQGHQLFRVFFYHDGAYTGSVLQCIPQDEFDLSKSWEQLKTKYNLDIVVCIAAGLKRGILNEEEASRHEKTSSNFSESMDLSGLGQLIEASIISDRLVSFGG